MNKQIINFSIPIVQSPALGMKASDLFTDLFRGMSVKGEHRQSQIDEDRNFEDELNTLEYVLRSRRNRRNLTDWELLQCMQRLDFRKKKGCPSKNSSELIGRSKDYVAKVLGISSGQVGKLRVINNFASIEIKDALRQGKYSIHSAYNATMALRKKRSSFQSVNNTELINAVLTDIRSRLNKTQIRKLVKNLQIELATN